MSRRLWLLIALVGLAIAGGLVVIRSGRSAVEGGAPDASARAEVTFTEHIAPLVFTHCAPCHHAGGPGPFSLITYEEVSDHAGDIRDVTERRFMPPWKPAPGGAPLANERRLRDEQVALFARWLSEGKRRGDDAKLPPRPTFTSTWRLGTPDLVVSLPQAYALPADGRDVYRNFVVPAPVSKLVYVKGWELSAETSAIHHAVVNVDRHGLARRRAAMEKGVGFPGMDVGDAQSPDGFYLVWTPGKTPTPIDEESAFRLDGQTDLVVQLHMQPTGKPERVQPKIALYFSSTPPTRPRITVRVGDRPIDIPPGASFLMRDEETVPADMELRTVFPHAHYLAKRVHTWVRAPDGTTRDLLIIDDWDFNWQDDYTFAPPVFVAKGSTLGTEITYDNSAANPRNPSRPPKHVRGGFESTDEMGNVTFSVVPADRGGMNALREAKYRRSLRGGESARERYNLGNALADQGKSAEALAEYRRAVALDEALTPARFNLAALLVATGATDEGIAEYRALCRRDPKHVGAWVNLGNALEAKKDEQGALEAFRGAVRADDRSALAHNALGAALVRRRAHREAIVHLERALAIEPGRALSHLRLAQAQQGAGDRGGAKLNFEKVLELDPENREARQGLAELGGQ